MALINKSDAEQVRKALGPWLAMNMDHQRVTRSRWCWDAQMFSEP